MIVRIVYILYCGTGVYRVCNCIIPVYLLVLIYVLKCILIPASSRIILGLISSIPRYFFTDWLKMGKTQLISKAYSKAMREAYRSGDRAKQQKLQKLSMQRQMDQAALSMNTMKPLMVTEIFFFLIFIWLYVFMLTIHYQYVSMPWDLNLNIVTTKLYIMPLWMGLYTLGNLAVGYFVTMIMKYVDFTYKIRKLDDDNAVRSI